MKDVSSIFYEKGWEPLSWGTLILLIVDGLAEAWGKETVFFMGLLGLGACDNLPVCPPCQRPW